MTEDADRFLERAVGRLEGKLDEVINSINRLTAVTRKYDERLDQIEKDIAYSKAIVAVIAVVISVGTPLALKYFNLA